MKEQDANYKSDKNIFFSDHHLSHAASAFFPSPFNEALVLTADGVGEWATTTVAVGQGNKLDIKKEIQLIIDNMALNNISQASLLLIKVSEDLDYMLDTSNDEKELIEISKYQVLLNHLQIKMSTKNN